MSSSQGGSAAVWDGPGRTCALARSTTHKPPTWCVLQVRALFVLVFIGGDDDDNDDYCDYDDDDNEDDAD